jgi:excisionase family DNA binding protein
MNESWALQQAAEFLKIHPDTLAQRARAGEIPGCKVGRSWVFSPKLLTEYLEARCTANIRQAPSKHSLAERLAAQLAQMPDRRKHPN